MCGIAGFLDTTRVTSAAELSQLVDDMARTLAHRGPDDQGTWVDERAGVALGFRRLSILDLSPLGRQPMESADGRYVLVFNGEIYNFRTLRNDLEKQGCRFRGDSDTEVLLASIVQWGLARALQRSNGMFALAVWDRHEETLSLARDRIGEKPLFYGRAGSRVLFGSELKALRAHPDLRPAVSRQALALYLRHNCVPAPWSIYEGILKLPPGSIVNISARDGALVTDPVAYWDLANHVSGADDRGQWSDEVAEEKLDALLRESVAMRTVADVPVGAFLSGGIDSSTVVALMQAQSARPVRTFTIGFSETEFNEAEDAKAVAGHLGTEHTELYVTPQDALAVVPLLPTMYDEPFADSSQIPTYLISQLARTDVTVSLSGDGGDELFGGYTRYLWAARLSKRLSWLPPALRHELGGRIATIKPDFWDRSAPLLDKVLPPNLRQRNLADKVSKLGHALRSADDIGIYRQLVSHWDPTTVLLRADEPKTLLQQPHLWPPLADFRETMMYLDTMTYLPNDILVKLDRASMAVSLEARVPLLDHRVVEFAWTLPMHTKIRGGTGKQILRGVLRRYVPSDLVERPKSGFAVPIDSWLRGPLRDWAENLLDERRLKNEGYFDPTTIRTKWRDHQERRANSQFLLWDILMFQAWLECQA